jgi:hypothetical protein
MHTSCFLICIQISKSQKNIFLEKKKTELATMQIKLSVMFSIAFSKAKLSVRKR